ncbi:hypothetical protein BsWGS_23925 [Bradybaena similaris]
MDPETGGDPGVVDAQTGEKATGRDPGVVDAQTGEKATGRDPGVVDAQTGEKATGRDPGVVGTRSSEVDGRPEVGASETEGGEPGAGVQTHDEERTGKDDRRKTKRGKTSQSASGSPAARHERELRFQEELRGLQTSLRRLGPRPRPPPRKPYQPYLFNSLRPYYSTSTARFLGNLHPDVKGHRSRRTAQGLMAPWIDLQMGHDLQSDSDTDPVCHGRNTQIHQKAKTTRRVGPAVGKGRPAQFSTVAPETAAVAGRHLDDSHMPILRLVLRGSSRRKLATDYQHFKQQVLSPYWPDT